MSRRIDYYFSLTSPWAYIGQRRLVGLARQRNATIVFKPVRLDEVFSETGGLPLAKRHPVRQAYRSVELQRWREKRALDFNLWPRHWPFDPTLADCAVLAITEQGDPAAFAEAVMEGVWKNEQNAADPAVLAAVIRRAGFEPEPILARAKAPAIREAYARNRLDALEAGVFGSPSYVLDGEIFWGQDRLELLDEALASGRPPFLVRTRA